MFTRFIRLLCGSSQLITTALASDPSSFQSLNPSILNVTNIELTAVKTLYQNIQM